MFPTEFTFFNYQFLIYTFCIYPFVFAVRENRHLQTYWTRTLQGVPLWAKLFVDSCEKSPPPIEADFCIVIQSPTCLPIVHIQIADNIRHCNVMLYFYLFPPRYLLTWLAVFHIHGVLTADFKKCMTLPLGHIYH